MKQLVLFFDSEGRQVQFVRLKVPYKTLKGFTDAANKRRADALKFPGIFEDELTAVRLEVWNTPNGYDKESVVFVLNLTGGVWE